MRVAGLQRWLTGLVVGLLAVGGVLAPGQNARMVLERAAFAVAYAMPDGTLPDFCDSAGRDDHGPAQHMLAAGCDACLLMAAPGLATNPPALAARVVAVAEPARIVPERPTGDTGGAGPPPVRAPPFLSLA